MATKMLKPKSESQAELIRQMQEEESRRRAAEQSRKDDAVTYMSSMDDVTEDLEKSESENGEVRGTDEIERMLADMNSAENPEETYGVFADPKMQRVLRQASNAVDAYERANGISDIQDAPMVQPEPSVDEINVLDESEMVTDIGGLSERRLPSVAYDMGLADIDMSMDMSGRALPSMGEDLLAQVEFGSQVGDIGFGY